MPVVAKNTEDSVFEQLKLEKANTDRTKGNDNKDYGMLHVWGFVVSHLHRVDKLCNQKDILNISPVHGEPEAILPTTVIRDLVPARIPQTHIV
jgi:hypothetical protein